MLLALLLRAPFVLGPLESDEAGLLLVARHWHDNGPYLYGDYWVDRPPLLLAYFAAADAVAGGLGVRLLGCLVAVLLVTSGALAGHVLGDNSGAWWGGLAAAALGSSYVIAGHMLNGMLQAAALVMFSCACTLLALRTQARPALQVTLGATAGLSGTAAVLVKQNFVDALVFAAVVLMAAWTRRAASGRAVLRVIGGVIGGILTVGAVLALWTVTSAPSNADLWFIMYGFRARAVETITSASMAGPLGRLPGLALAGIGSGIIAFMAVLAGAARRLLRDRVLMPAAWGTMAMLVVAILGVGLGFSSWRHYWIQIVPACVLAAALVTSSATSSARVMRWATVIAVISSVTASGVGALAQQISPPDETTIGRWLRGSTERADTGVVLYGHAEVLYEAGLQSPYPHLWSLPTRTLDPHLQLLTEIVSGPKAPTWIIEWNQIDSWGIDHGGRLAAAMTRRYRVVANPCGHDIYLLRGSTREVPPPPVCDAGNGNASSPGSET